MKTKHLLSLAAVFLVAALLLPLSSSVGAKAEEKAVLGNLNQAYSEFGWKMGMASNHGNNQTRIAYTSTGVYISCPTEDFDSGLDPYCNKNLPYTNFVLYVVRPDGSVKLLVEDKLFMVAAGTTTNVMVDKNEDIWVVTSWDEGSGFYPLIAWQYDVSEDTTHKYEILGYYNRGSDYGKPLSIMDAVNNKIYVVAFCGYQRLASGRVMWTTFDIETKTWEKNITCVKVPCGCCYEFGYADGKGGFFFVTSRTVNNEAIPTNIEGMSVQQAMSQFKNRRSYDVGQCWDETYLYYVPDASGNTILSQCFGDAAYDVENGVYPLVINRSSDAFYDETTGLFYVLRLEQDCGGFIGLREMLYIFDTGHLEGEKTDGNIFPMICQKEISFSYGSGVNYFPHVVKDAEDNLYIVVATEQAGEIEIWRATDQIGSEYEFVFSGNLSPAYRKGDYSEWRSLIAGTNRNNSMKSDLVYFLYDGGKPWESFSVDFAVLREMTEGGD